MPKPKTKIVAESYNEELEKTIKRINKDGKADQVVQFIKSYEDHDQLCRTGHWTTVILRVPCE